LDFGLGRVEDTLRDMMKNKWGRKDKMRDVNRVNEGLGKGMNRVMMMRRKEGDTEGHDLSDY
jgi:hypothetical protein